MKPMRLLVLAGLIGAPTLARAEAPVWHRAAHVATRLEADGRYDTIQSWDVTAETPSAAHVAAQQSFGFSGELEDVALLEAYTSKQDGRREAVAPDAILHQGLAAGVTYPSFSDWQVRTIVFPDVEPGDTVHFMIERKARQALFLGQFESTLHIGPASNIDAADIAIDMPAGMQLRVAATDLAEGAPLEADGRLIRHWHLDRADGPDGSQVGLQVSSFASYAALGDAFAAGAWPKAAPTPAIRTRADAITADADGPEDKARLLYEYVARQIRYVGVQAGAARVVPHDAETVLRLGYGDCKDHVALLMALLAAEDIDAEPALISTHSHYDLSPTPTLDLLDHVIIYLPDFDLYADSTSPFAPFGVLPFSEYGKPVILARRSGSTVERVPPLPPGLAAARARTDLTVGADGTVTGATVTTAEGPSAITLREVAASIEDEGPGIAAQDQLRRLGTPGEGDFSFATPLDLGDSYGLKADFTLEDKLADGQDDHFTLPGGLTVLSRGAAFLLGEDATDHGGHLCYAGQQAETIRMHLPKGIGITLLPHDVALAGGYASYQASYATEGNTLVVHRDFTLATPHPLCTPAEYEAMRPVLLAARRDTRAELSIARSVTIGSAR